MHRRWLAVTAVLLCGVLAGCGTTVRQATPGASTDTRSLLREGAVPSADPTAGTDLQSPGVSTASVGADPVVTPTELENVSAGEPSAAAARPTARSASGKSEDRKRAATKSPPKSGAPKTGAKAAAGSTGVVSLAAAVLKVGLAIPGNSPSSSLTGAPSTSDYPAIAKAVVADINAHGGIAGRQVSLDIATVGSASDNDEAVAAQDIACTSLTEDDHDTVVLGTDASAAYATQCYVDHKTPLLVDKHLLDVSGIAAGTPWLLPSASANYSDTARNLPIALQAQGYYAGKIATVAYDLPALRGAVLNTLVPGITQAGGNVVDSVFLPPSETSAPQAIASDILRFRQEGVDHVVFLSGLWPLFAVAAQAQAYFPRYAITTEDLPAYSYNGFHVPAQQAQGLVGIGWVPAEDLTGAGVTPLSPQEQSCLTIIDKGAGLSYADRGDGDYFNGLDLCEVFRELKAALDPAAGKPIAPQDIAGLVADTPSSYQPTLIASAAFRPGGTDYTGGYQWLAFGAACSCFQYTSGSKPFLR